MNWRLLRHPFQTARSAKRRLNVHMHMWTFGNHGRRRFRNDPRYDLRNVTEGFAPNVNNSPDDREMLKRICVSYRKAVEREQESDHRFLPSDSWERLRQGPLSASIRALEEEDIDALSRMYRNFYRDPCSAGLMAPPHGLANAYFNGRIKDFYRHFYLSHVLYRLDYWDELTRSQFKLRNLVGPGIGNPFGISLDETLIVVGSEYAHYCASRVADLIDRTNMPRPVVAEIGGGFGAMAYYLLRDHRPATYFAFDLPETIALSSYYLMKAFPFLKFRLYGETPSNQGQSDQADVALMPFLALDDLDSESLDIAFSSSGMARISPESVKRCVEQTARATKHSLLYIGNRPSSEALENFLGASETHFKLQESRQSGWHSHKISGAGAGGKRGRSSSMLLEQTFTK